MKQMQEKVNNTEIIDVDKIVDNGLFYEYGDLWLKCSCGHEYNVAKGFKHGLSFVLFSKSNAFWKMTCDGCNTEMTLFFKESDEETILKSKEKEELENKKDELLCEGDITEVCTEGVSEDAQSSDGTYSS